MSAERLVYLDSSAIVKLVVHEPESPALRRHLRRRRLVASALARTEVMRSVLLLDADVVMRARDVLRSIDLVRVTDRILDAAGELTPSEMRSLDAIHVATALALGASVKHVVTYDDRMTKAARAARLRVLAPK
jgi:predicted nucleic acid-binding protein